MRFRAMAGEALKAFGLRDARFSFIALAGNALFRVYNSPVNSAKGDRDPFEPGQYLLRIHDRREQDAEAIRLEMAWLRAIREDTGLPVPEPVRTVSGSLLARISHPKSPESSDCTLLRWLKGRRVSKNIRPWHYQAQGEIMAQLHNHAAQWTMPEGLTKRKFDYDGLFIDDAGSGLPNSEAWNLLSDRYRRAYDRIRQMTRLAMEDLGTGREVYGLIHGDCGVDANIVFLKGRAHIIDFDGSGFGYYLYDLALALEHCWEEPGYLIYLDSLLKGYDKFRSLPDYQLAHIDLFRAAFYVYMGLWTVAMDKMYPDSPNKQSRHQKWLIYGLKFIEQFLARSD